MQSFLELNVLSKSFFKTVPWFMQQWVCINGHLESIIVSNPSDTMGDANTRQMTLKDYMYPTRSTQPFYITLSSLTANFKIKSDMIHMLPVFRELINKNPYQHVRGFEDICGTMKYNQITEESLKLRLFLFSLKEKQRLGYFLFSLEQSPIG